MKRPISLLALTAALALGVAWAQADATRDETTHDKHEGHDEHEGHGAIDGGTLFTLGDRSYALVPLVSKRDDGYRATLVLTPAGADTAAMTHADDAAGHEHDAAAEDHHDDEHAAGEDHRDDEHAAGEDHHDDDHAAGEDDHGHADGEHLTVALLDPDGSVAVLTDLAPSSDGTVTAYSLPWFDGLALGDFDGVWRLSVANDDHRTEVPISVVSRPDASTELVAVFAPAPSLSGAGRTELFLYAYRGLEPVHAAVAVQRAMPGMQHATDEETVALVHDHFTALTEVAPIDDAMANRAPLAFAMAGIWDLTVTIEGTDPETVVLQVAVLGE